MTAGLVAVVRILSNFVQQILMLVMASATARSVLPCTKTVLKDRQRHAKTLVHHSGSACVSDCLSVRCSTLMPEWHAWPKHACKSGYSCPDLGK